jgi:hypothetical protein
VNISYEKWFKQVQWTLDLFLNTLMDLLLAQETSLRESICLKSEPNHSYHPHLTFVVDFVFINFCFVQFAFNLAKALALKKYNVLEDQIITFQVLP